jgi:RHS repeat-associated protein
MYAYDSIGQLISAKKFWPDWTPVAGQQFEYTFDDIGNRTQTKVGGDEHGANLRTASYTANSLNQYTNRDIPGAVDVMGLELGTNTVTVNGQTPYRYGEYFRKELAVNNSSTALWTNITVSAPYETTANGNVFVAKTPETFGYDADGNMTNDGHWFITWDAENRPISLAAKTNVGPPILIKFEYDSENRRTRKQVWGNSAGTGNPTNDLVFIYDNWNLIATLDATNAIPTQCYVWGADLSDSIQGAGGVGGLLLLAERSTINNQPSSHFAAYDGNGNVTALLNATNGLVSGVDEYGPFGEVIRATGSMAKANPLRYSTKYQDDETGIFFYGYRHYSADAGRWMSRDPIAESGAALLRDLGGLVDASGLERAVSAAIEQGLLRAELELYQLNGNDGVNFVDPVGLMIYRCFLL